MYLINDEISLIMRPVRRCFFVNTDDKMQKFDDLEKIL